MSKLFKSVAKFALPAIGTLVAPGIGTALGSTLSGAALSGIGGAIGGGLGGAVGGGGLKGALMGAALGGGGGYLMGGGSIPGLGSMGGSLGAGGMGPPTPGTGILGSLGGGSSTGLGGIGSLIRPAASIYGGLQQSGTIDDMEKQMLSAQGRAAEQFQPLQEQFAAGFDPSQLADDPGYQFRMQQGQAALDRSLGAQGLSQSGAAIKAAQDQAQGLAAQQYNDAYQQWLQRMYPQQQLAGNMADVYGNMGNIQATATGGRSNVISKTMADLLSEEQFGRYI